MKTQNTIHGIDPYAPGGIEALLDFHRQTFGDAVMEAGGPAPAADPAPTADPSPAPADPADPAPADPAPSDPAAPEADKKPWGSDEEFDPEKAWKLIQNLRADKANVDTKAQTAAQEAAQKAQDELTQKLGKALGLVKDGEDAPDADALSKALAERDDTIRELTIKSALPDALETHKANKLTYVVLKDEGRLKDLDPSANDFQEKLSGLVKDAVNRHPELRTAQVAGQSGADFTGTDPGKRSKTPLSLRDAAAIHYGT